MTQSANRQHAVALVLCVSVLCALANVGDAEIALAFAPMALLVSSLLGGCYPGEATLVWMAAKVAQRAPRTRGGSRAVRPATANVGLTNGGLLIARRLCGRAPPLPAR